MNREELVKYTEKLFEDKYDSLTNEEIELEIKKYSQGSMSLS